MNELSLEASEKSGDVISEISTNLLNLNLSFSENEGKGNAYNTYLSDSSDSEYSMTENETIDDTISTLPYEYLVDKTIDDETEVAGRSLPTKEDVFYPYNYDLDVSQDSIQANVINTIEITKPNITPLTKGLSLFRL